MKKRTNTAAKDPKKTAKIDQQNKRWNPNQFPDESRREAYGRSWDYYYTTSGDKARNWHMRG